MPDTIRSDTKPLEETLDRPPQQDTAKDSAREGILKAARGLFAERGYSGTSMSALAKAAGVSQALIHHHFGHKRALWTEVGRDWLRQVGGRIFALEEAPPSLDAFRQLLRDLLRPGLSDPQLIRFIAWCQLDGDPTVDPIEQAMLGTLERFVQRGQQLGAIRADVPPLHLVFVATSAVESIARDRHRLTSLLGEEGLNNFADAVIDTLVRTFASCPPQSESASGAISQ